MKHIGIVNVTTVGACICANEIVLEANRRGLGDNHPEFTLHAFPFAMYKKLVLEKNWEEIAKLISASILKLKNAGAEFVILPVNTIHYAINEIIESSPLPVLNLIEITTKECVRRNFKKVAVLGTKQTMENGLYDARLKQNGITPIIPPEKIRDKIQYLIFNEILQGRTNSETVDNLRKDIKQLNCDAVILGCTELPEVYNEENVGVCVIDTTRLLAHKALDYSLNVG